MQLRKVVSDNKFEVSTFDKDEVYVYDLKKILEIALGPKKLSSQAIYILTTDLYNEFWITTVPKIIESVKKERKTKQSKAAEKVQTKQAAVIEDLEYEDDFDDDLEDAKVKPTKVVNKEIDTFDEDDYKDDEF